MRITEDQIRLRRKLEDRELEEAFFEMAGAVMGAEAVPADDTRLAREAVGHLARYFHLKDDEECGAMTLEESLDKRLRTNGVCWRGVRLEKDWYKNAIGAFIARRKEDGIPVALIPGRTGGYCFIGSDGKRHRVTQRNMGLFREEALLFYRAFPDKKLSVPLLLRFMMGCIGWADCFGMLFAAAASALVGLLIPYLNAKLFSDVTTGGSMDLLIAVGIFYLSAVVSKELIEVIYGAFITRISMKIEIQTEAATMMRVLDLPVSFFRSFSAGELSTRIASMGTLCNLLVTMALKTGITGIFSLAYIVQIASFTPTLTVPALLILFATSAFDVFAALAQEKCLLQYYTLEGKEKGISYRLISGIRKIRVAGAEKRGFSRWAKLYASAVNCQNIITRYGSVIAMAIGLLGTWLLYGIALRSGVSIVQYRAFAVAYGMVSGALMQMVSVVSSIASIRPALTRTRPILETMPERSAGKKTVTSLNGAIHMENVCFRYNPDSELIANHLDLKIDPGEYVAIVGKTGMGKSTLIRLLIGFETPELGSISYDGQNIKTLDLVSLRRHIGIVMQGGKLVQGDIYDNIAVTCPGLSLEDAWAAAEIAGIADDIRAMPLGMSTPITGTGSSISGGQKQRILIARAIAPKPRVLIFDEATSALDNITQKRVSEALDNLLCTRIVIAHRLSTIRHCDRILVLDRGRIVSDGSYEELLRTSDIFRELVERQRIDV